MESAHNVVSFARNYNVVSGDLVFMLAQTEHVADFKIRLHEDVPLRSFGVLCLARPECHQGIKPLDLVYREAEQVPMEARARNWFLEIGLRNW